MILGLGTGSTAKLAVDALGKRVQAGLHIVGIATSEFTARQARAVGIRISSLAEYAEVDLTIDGADEIQRGTLDLIKGHGGALLREKVVASASRRLIIIADESKLVDRPGTRFAVPVEVVPFGWQAAERKLQMLGAHTKLRPGPDEKPFVTDGGNFIVDCSFSPIEAPAALDQELNNIVGVVEHGLFLGMVTQAIVAGRDGVNVLFPAQRRIRSEALAIPGVGFGAGIAAQPHGWKVIVQRRQIGLWYQKCLVLQAVLVYICQNCRRTGIGIVRFADHLNPGESVACNSQRNDGKAGWPPPSPEGWEQREASEQIEHWQKRQ